MGAARGAASRNTLIVSIHRQPRPRLQLEVFTPLRCMLFQKLGAPTVLVAEHKLTSRREEEYSAFRKSMQRLIQDSSEHRLF